MRTRRIISRTSLVGVIGLLGGLAPVVAMVATAPPAAPAGLCTLLSPCLEVTNEVSHASVGSPIVLTATMDPAPAQNTTIDWEIEGGPADIDGVSRLTPDRRCVI